MRYILLYGPPKYNRLVSKYISDQYSEDLRLVNIDSAKLPPRIKWDANVAAVILTGGPDIDPAIYGRTPHKRTQQPDKQRDLREQAIFSICKTHRIPMIGICRGAQLLNALNGGKTIQHVENHTVDHQMVRAGPYEFDDIPSVFSVTSTHHQMMVMGEDAQLLGYTINTAFRTGQVEPEVISYPKTKSLCFQYHPEMMNIDTHGREYFHKIVEEEIFKYGV